MKQIKIVHYSSEWEKQHQIFAKEYFNGRRKRIIPEYLYWKYRKKENEQSISLLLAVDGKRVIGQLGMIPTIIRLKNEVYNAFWACDLMVCTNFRGMGIANMLYEEAVRNKIVLGSDPSIAASKSMKEYGFKNLVGPWKYFFPIYIDAITQKKFKYFNKIFKNVLNPLILILSFKNFIKSSSNIQLIEISFIDINWEWLNKYNNVNELHILHDELFLRWRLSMFKNYQKSGICFQQKDKYLLLCRENSECCMIGDFLYDSIITAKIILRALVLKCYKNGIREIRWFANNNIDQRVLADLGFIKFRTRTNLIYSTEDYYFINNLKGVNFFYYTYFDSDEDI
jgi:hypothetical protein